MTTPQPSYTYGQFSMMDQRHAGQLEADGKPASQWAWTPISPTTSNIQWGDPGDWPPTSYERFERVEDWVMLNGFGDTDTGEFVDLVVTRELMGDVHCHNMAPIPGPRGRQHYVKWTIPRAGYCLQAWGFMTYQDTRIDFHHHQVWFPPSGPYCSNRHYRNRRCIKQYEIWQDNNGDPGGPLVERHNRDNVLALGLGPGFVSHSYLDDGWHAEMWANWAW